MEGTKLTGLWKNQAEKSGKTYLAGNLSTARVLILPNDFKEKDTDPDYNLWIVPKNGRKEKEEDKI